MHRSISSAAILLLLALVGSAQAGFLGDALSAVLPSRSTSPAPVTKNEAKIRPQQIIFNNSEVPAWRGRLDTKYGRSYFAPAIFQNRCNSERQNCTAWPELSYPYEQYMWDPTVTEAADAVPVMMIRYPAGSWSPSSARPGGTLFYYYPYKENPSSLANPFSRSTAVLEYDVYFPPEFDFVKGGKLPGFSGGDRLGRGCGGGANPEICFSYRIMWRRNGAGEAYLYVPEGKQGPGFCDAPCGGANAPRPCTLCDYKSGVSFKRGAWTFQKGTWTTLRLTMTLNTANVTDGVIQLAVNGTTVIDFRGMNWRQYDDISVEGVTMSSWFGGGDNTWAPKSDTYTLLRNFRMYYEGPVAAISQRNSGGSTSTRMATLSGSPIVGAAKSVSSGATATAAGMEALEMQQIALQDPSQQIVVEGYVDEP